MKMLLQKQLEEQRQLRLDLPPSTEASGSSSLKYTYHIPAAKGLLA